MTLSSKDTSVIQNWFCISAVQNFADVCLHVVTVYQGSEAIWKICEANCKMLAGGHLTFWTLKRHQTCPLHPSCVLYLHPSLICALFLLLLFLHPFFQVHIFKQWPVRQPLLNTGLQTELAVLLEDYIRAHLRKLCTGCYFHNPSLCSGTELWKWQSRKALDLKLSGGHSWWGTKPLKGMHVDSQRKNVLKIQNECMWFVRKIKKNQIKLMLCPQ